MMDEITKYQDALSLHQEIMANGEIAAASLLEMCKGLKRMRDEKLYTALSYDTFEDYCEKMAGIKSRQAYTYISTYERLGSTFLQSNASLGVTKLELIASVPGVERAELLENDLAGMSVKEIKDLIAKSKEQTEQISFLQAELSEKESAENGDALQEQITAKQEEIAALEKKVKELESKPVEVAVSEPTAEDYASIRAEAKKELERDFKEKQKKLIEKESQKAAAAREKEITEQLSQKFAAEIESLKAAVSGKEERERELEKQIKLSDSESTKAKIYFGGMQDNFNKLLETVRKMDTESGEKFKAAVTTALKQFLEAVK